MWTRHTVQTKITDHLEGTKLPAWVPVAPWQEQLAAHCWAKAKDSPIRWLCLEKGWSKSSHYRHIRTAGSRMADSMNLDEALAHAID